MSVENLGAAVSWQRHPSKSGIVLSIRLAETPADFHAECFREVQFALNDRQLRQIAIDLVKSASERGITFYPPRRWWNFW